MSVDEITKIILITGVTLSILGISFQIMRVIGGAADLLSDLRKTIKNIGEITDKVVEDYKALSKVIELITNTLSGINDKVLTPLVSFGSVIGMFSGFFNKNKSQEDKN